MIHDKLENEIIKEIEENDIDTLDYYYNLVMGRHITIEMSEFMELVKKHFPEKFV